jgi:hypothetical protein
MPDLGSSLLAHPSHLSSITNATCSDSIDHLLHRLVCPTMGRSRESASGSVSTSRDVNHDPPKTELQWSTVRQDAFEKSGKQMDFHHLRGAFPLGFTNPEPPVNTIIIARPNRPSFRLPVDGTAVISAWQINPALNPS